MLLIGICGKAGSGKDTAGNYLVENYEFSKIALADPLKRLVKDVFALDDHTVYDRTAREQPLKQWNDWSVRKLLQFIGTELFRNNIDDEIWVKSLWYKIKDSKKNFVVTDVRFPNELKFFENNGGKNFISIKVVRPGFEGNVGLSNHASEAYDLTTQYAISNESDFAFLYKQIDDIMAFNGVPKKERKNE